MAGTNLDFKQNKSREYSNTGGHGPGSQGRKMTKSWWELRVTEALLPLWLGGSNFSVVQSTWWIITNQRSTVFWPHDFPSSGSLFACLSASLSSGVFSPTSKSPGKRILVG